MIEKIFINTEYIKLDCALKFCGASVTGSEAKEAVVSGKVKVNGEIEMRRGKKLYANDKLSFAGKEYEIALR